MDLQDENNYITKIMRKNHNFEAACDFQIQSSFDTVTNYLNAHYSTLLMSNEKKMKLYHKKSLYLPENLNVNEKINNGSKLLMVTGTLDNFFMHAHIFSVMQFYGSGSFMHEDI